MIVIKRLIVQCNVIHHVIMLMMKDIRKAGDLYVGNTWNHILPSSSRSPPHLTITIIFFLFFWGARRSLFITLHKYSFGHTWSTDFDFVNSHLRGTLSEGGSYKPPGGKLKPLSSSAFSPTPTLNTSLGGGGENKLLQKKFSPTFPFPLCSIFGGCCQHSGPGSWTPHNSPPLRSSAFCWLKRQNSGKLWARSAAPRVRSF